MGVTLLGIYPKGRETYVLTGTRTHVPSGYIHNGQDVEATEMSLSRWMAG